MTFIIAIESLSFSSLNRKVGIPFDEWAHVIININLVMIYCIQVARLPKALAPQCSLILATPLWDRQASGYDCFTGRG